MQSQINKCNRGLEDFQLRKGMEHPRSGPPRERRLKAGKMLQWSILSESPISYAAKVREEEAPWRAPEANEDWVEGANTMFATGTQFNSENIAATIFPPESYKANRSFDIESGGCHPGSLLNTLSVVQVE